MQGLTGIFVVGITFELIDRLPDFLCIISNLLQILAVSVRQLSLKDICSHNNVKP